MTTTIRTAISSTAAWTTTAELYLLRHGKIHGFRPIAFDDTMLDVAIDERGHKTMAQTLLKPLGYLLCPTTTPSGKLNRKTRIMKNTNNGIGNDRHRYWHFSSN